MVLITACGSAPRDGFMVVDTTPAPPAAPSAVARTAPAPAPTASPVEPPPDPPAPPPDEPTTEETDLCIIDPTLCEPMDPALVKNCHCQRASPHDTQKCLVDCVARERKRVNEELKRLGP